MGFGMAVAKTKCALFIVPYGNHIDPVVVFGVGINQKGADIPAPKISALDKDIFGAWSPDLRIFFDRNGGMLAVQGAGNRVTVKSQTLTDVLTANPAISRAMVAVRVVHVGKEFAGPDAFLDTLNVFTAVGTGVSRGQRPVKRSAMVVSSDHDAVVVIGVHVPTQGQLLLVSLTTRAGGQFLCLGQGWQQQGGQDGDDRDDNQQLNQGESHNWFNFHSAFNSSAVLPPCLRRRSAVAVLHPLRAASEPVWRVRPSPQNYSGWTTRKKAFRSMMGVSKVVLFVAPPTFSHEPSPKAVRD